MCHRPELVTELVSRHLVVTSYRVPSGLFTTCRPHVRLEHAYVVLYQYGLCGDNRLPKLDVGGTVDNVGNGIRMNRST